MPVIEGLDGFGPWLDDPAMNRLWITIEEELSFRGQRLLHHCGLGRLPARAFHPVRDYIDTLKWDGKPRVDTWLVDHFGAEDNPYTRAVSAIVLIAAVRRVRQPGVKFDEMMVWEGPQGQQKSGALAVMAVDPDWFSD